MQRELEVIVFIKVDARWVHHPHADALVITARIANNNAHRLMVDDGSIVYILYLDAYKRMRLGKNTLNPVTFPLYGFTRDHVMPKGTTKLAVMVGEHLRTSTIIADFLVVDYPSAINGIIERLLLKGLKVVTSIYHLTMKFPIIEGTCKVVSMIRGNVIINPSKWQRKTTNCQG